MFSHLVNMFNNFCIKAVVAATPLPAVPSQTAPLPVATPVTIPTAATPVQMPVNMPANLPANFPAAAHSVHTMNVLQYIILFVYFAICAALIFLVLVQTSKSEGLTGTLGGATHTVFKGKKSFDEQIEKITTYVAVLFVVLSIVIAWFVFR